MPEPLAYGHGSRFSDALRVGTGSRTCQLAPQPDPGSCRLPERGRQPSCQTRSFSLCVGSSGCRRASASFSTSTSSHPAEGETKEIYTLGTSLSSSPPTLYKNNLAAPPQRIPAQTGHLDGRALLPSHTSRGLEGRRSMRRCSIGFVSVLVSHGVSENHGKIMGKSWFFIIFIRTMMAYDWDINGD